MTGLGLETLRQRQRRGVAVATQLGMHGATKALLMLQTIVVARLYGPEVLGAFATLLLIVNGFASAMSTGIDRFLLKSESAGIEGRSDTALTMTLFVATLSMTALWLLASPVLSIFGATEMVPELRWLALLLFMPLATLPAVLWERRMQFARANLPAVLAPVAFLLVAGGGALAGSASTENLVFAQVAAVVMAALVAWTTAPYRPRLGYDPGAARSLVRFSLPLLLSGLLAFLAAQGDDFLVRLMYDDRGLGLYTIAFYLPAQILSLVAVLGRVAVPALAEVRTSRPALNVVFSEFSGYIAALTIGAGAALALFAEPVVLLLYGAAWLEVVPLVQIFSIAFIIRGATGYHWQALAVLFDRTDYILKVSAWTVVFLLLTAPWLIWRFGLYGGAIYSVVQLAVMGPIVRFPLIRDILGSLSFLRTTVPPLLAGGAAIAIVGLGRILLPDGTGWTLVLLLLYGVGYTAVLLALQPTLRSDVRFLIARASARSGG